MKIIYIRYIKKRQTWAGGNETDDGGGNDRSEAKTLSGFSGSLAVKRFPGSIRDVCVKTFTFF